jgi:hypothetical protein
MGELDCFVVVNVPPSAVGLVVLFVRTIYFYIYKFSSGGFFILGPAVIPEGTGTAYQRYIAQRYY